MLCYGTKIGKQPLNELENDNECEKDLKDNIDALKEKIHALTEEKEKYEKEYNRLCNLKKYRNVLKDDSNKHRQFRIIIGCRKDKSDNEHWTNILINESILSSLGIFKTCIFLVISLKQKNKRHYSDWNCDKSTWADKSRY